MLGAVLIVISVLGLYVEAVVQFCTLFNSISDDSTNFPVSLVVVVALCISISFLATNIASLLLAFRCLEEEEEEEKTEEEGEADKADRTKRRKGLCIAAHAFQLGLAWRVYRILSTRRNQTRLRHLAVLRLIHPSLASFPYVIVVSREMVAPGYDGFTTLSLVSLVVSIGSSSLAFAYYVLRHQPAMTGWVRAEADRSGVPVAGRTLRCAGVLVLVAGTYLCLAARLGVFALMSAQHGAWILLPLLAHLSIQTTVHFTCSTRHHTGHNDDASQGTVTKSDGEKNRHPTFGDQIHANLEPEMGRNGNYCSCGNGCCRTDESRDGISASTAVDCRHNFSTRAEVFRCGSNDVSEHFVTDSKNHCQHHHYQDDAFGFIPTASNNRNPCEAAETTQNTNIYPNTAEINAKSTTHSLSEEPFSSFFSSTTTKTKRKEEKTEKKTHRRTLTAITVLRGLAESYLNTMDLTDGSVSGARCRHVLYYSLVLVENLAMAAAWMLQSPLGSEARLLLSVGLVAAFLLGLVLKVAACGCLAGGHCAGDGDDGDRDDAGGGRPRGSIGLSSSCPGTPRLPAVCHVGNADGLQLRQHSHRNVRGRHYSSTPSLYNKGNIDFYPSATPRPRSDASVSMGTISSRNRDNSLGRSRARQATTRDRRQQQGSSRSIGDLNNTRTTAFLSDYINVQQALEQRSLSRSGSNQASNERRRPSRRENNVRANVPRKISIPGSRDNNDEYHLVTEGNQRHLKALVRDRADSLDGVWTTSSTGVFSDEQEDSCSFDDPIIASQLVIESLCGRQDSRRRPSSQCTSSTQSRQHSEHSHSHRTSSIAEPRVFEARKPDLAFIKEGVRSDGETYAEYGRTLTVMPVQRTPRRSAMPRSSCEVHGDHVQYSYWTRCTCRGSPTSTPRRRPQKQVLPRKARSNCTASRPYRPSDGAAVSGRGNHASRDNHAHGTCRHRHKKSKTAQSLTDDPRHQHRRRPGDDRKVEPSVSSTDEEESRWVDAFKSKCSSSRLPLSIPLAVRNDANNYANIRQSNQNQELLHDHWPWCHHHGNDREGEWPRRSFRAALEGGGGKKKEISSPALHDDTSSVSAQDVVHLWLLSTNARHENLPCASPRNTEARSALASYLHLTPAAVRGEEESTDCSLCVRPGDSDVCGSGDGDDDDDVGNDDEVFVLMKQQSASANQFNRSSLSSRLPSRTIEHTHTTTTTTLSASRKKKTTEMNVVEAMHLDKTPRLLLGQSSTGLSSDAPNFRADRNALPSENVKKRHTETLRQATVSSLKSREEEDARRDAELATCARQSERQRPASPITTVPCDPDLYDEDDSDVTLSDTRTSDSDPSSSRAANANAAIDEPPLRRQPAGSSVSTSRPFPSSDSHRTNQVVADSGVPSSTMPDAEGPVIRPPLNGRGQATTTPKSPGSDSSRSNGKGYVSMSPNSEKSKRDTKGHISRLSDNEGSRFSAEAHGSSGPGVTVSKPPLGDSVFSTLKGKEEDRRRDLLESKCTDEASPDSGLSIYGEDVTKPFRPDRVVKLGMHESLV